MDTLIDVLPGFPDGISRSEDGNFWIAIVAPRSPVIPLLRYGAPLSLEDGLRPARLGG